MRSVPRLRKIVIGVLGVTVLLFGVALIFLPGPGLIVILIGFAILATEFAWARWLMRRGRMIVKKAGRRRNTPAPGIMAGIS